MALENGLLDPLLPLFLVIPEQPQREGMELPQGVDVGGLHGLHEEVDDDRHYVRGHHRRYQHRQDGEAVERVPPLGLPGHGLEVVGLVDELGQGAGGLEDRQEDDDDVLCQVPVHGPEDMDDQRNGFQAQGVDVLEGADGQDGEGGAGADYDVERHSELLGKARPGGMFDIRHGGQGGRGTDTSLVLEQAAGHPDRQDRAQTSAEHGGHVERVGEDAPERRDGASGDEDYGEDADADPLEGHDRDDPRQRLDDPPRPQVDEDGHRGCEANGEKDVVVLELEHRTEGHGRGVLLDGDEPDTVRQRYHQGDDHAELLLPDAVLDVIGQTAPETVLPAFLEQLSEGGFDECWGHAEECEDPHPEDLPGPS